MNALDAADLTVHDYPGGSESLAPRLGISAAILRGKVNVNNDRNHLTLAEADRMMAVTGDHRILQALAAEHGYALTRMDETPRQGSIAAALLELGMARGELSRVILDALQDGVISDNEMDAIVAAGLADQAHTIGLINRLRQARDEARPRAA
jgi:hypothetical protein